MSTNAKTEMGIVPDIADHWPVLIADMENLAERSASIDEIRQAREQLREILGDVDLTPENGVLIAEVGLNEQGLL